MGNVLSRCVVFSCVHLFSATLQVRRFRFRFIWFVLCWIETAVTWAEWNPIFSQIITPSVAHYVHKTIAQNHSQTHSSSHCVCVCCAFSKYITRRWKFYRNFCSNLWMGFAISDESLNDVRRFCFAALYYHRERSRKNATSKPRFSGALITSAAARANSFMVSSTPWKEGTSKRRTELQYSLTYGFFLYKCTLIGKVAS